MFSQQVVLFRAGHKADSVEASLNIPRFKTDKINCQHESYLQETKYLSPIEGLSKGGKNYFVDRARLV